jgi:hypothetical protein
VKGKPLKQVMKILVFAGVVLAAYFLLKPRVYWLDSFMGTVEEKVETATPTVRDRRPVETSDYFLRVATDDGRELTVRVDQLVYFKAREGMQVVKESFSNELRILE